MKGNQHKTKKARKKTAEDFVSLANSHTEWETIKKWQALLLTVYPGPAPKPSKSWGGFKVVSTLLSQRRAILCLARTFEWAKIHPEHHRYPRSASVFFFFFLIRYGTATHGESSEVLRLRRNKSVLIQYNSPWTCGAFSAHLGFYF